MSEKLARFMHGVAAAVEERQPEEREAYLGALIAGAMRLRLRDERRGYERGAADWHSAETFLRFKLSAIQETRLLAEREKEVA